MDSIIFIALFWADFNNSFLLTIDQGARVFLQSWKNHLPADDLEKGSRILRRSQVLLEVIFKWCGWKRAEEITRITNMNDIWAYLVK